MAAGAAIGSAATASKPNVLVIITDDQRFITLHAVNNPDVRTPNIDKLVGRGVTFTQAHIMGGSIPAVCAPSRAMMLTGQTLFHVTDSIIQPKPERAKPFDLYPEIFRKAGYSTFGTGKWHNGPKLFNRCFSDGDNIFFGGMADHLQTPVFQYDPSGKYEETAKRNAPKFSSEAFTDSAVGFLQGQKEAKTPFLLYVAYTAPHDPRMAPARFKDSYPASQMKVPDNFLGQHPFDNGELKVRDELLASFPRTRENIQDQLSDYYAMITEVDEQIGRVLDALEASGHANNTVVVFAGDNGLALGQHGLMGKQSLYDHSVRVPFVIGGPGLPRNKRRDDLCYNSDMAPTLLDLAALPIPKSIETQSLVGNAPKRDSLFLAYRNVQRGVCTSRYKLIQYNASGVKNTQLFDLQHDPLEKVNLAADGKHEAIVRELNEKLKTWMRKVDDPISLDADRWGA
jgi:arylsulfatase A-like enzyme